MKIGVLTEGVSEVRGLAMLYTQIHSRCPNRLLQPLKINVDPLAAPGILARECKSRLLIARQQGASRSLVILDRENREDCPGEIAQSIEAAINKICPIMPVQVVLKDRAFENWLIADPDALAVQKGRFRVTAAQRSRISPGKADRCDGYSLLSSMAVKQQYRKVADSQLICGKMDIYKAARNSRSLRHLLHAVGAFEYELQCRTAVS